MEVFDDYLASQEYLASSLEQRGGRIPVVSGSIVTALAAFAAFRPAAVDTATSACGIVVLIVLAIVAFSSAVLLSIGVQMPRRQERLAHETLDKLAGDEKLWEYDTDESVALQRTAKLKATVARSARKSNQTKATWLIRAYVAQAVGIFLVAIAVVWTLLIAA